MRIKWTSVCNHNFLLPSSDHVFLSTVLFFSLPLRSLQLHYNLSGCTCFFFYCSSGPNPSNGWALWVCWALAVEFLNDCSLSVGSETNPWRKLNKYRINTLYFWIKWVQMVKYFSFHQFTWLPLRSVTQKLTSQLRHILNKPTCHLSELQTKNSGHWWKLILKKVL